MKTFADLCSEKDPDNLAFISEESQLQQKSEISNINDLNCYLHKLHSSLLLLFDNY